MVSVSNIRTGTNATFSNEDWNKLPSRLKKRFKVLGQTDDIKLPAVNEDMDFPELNETTSVKTGDITPKNGKGRNKKTAG